MSKKSLRKKTSFVPRSALAGAFVGMGVIPLCVTACGGKTQGQQQQASVACECFSCPQAPNCYSVAEMSFDGGGPSVAVIGFDGGPGVAIDAFTVADVGFDADAGMHDAPVGVAADAFGVADSGFGGPDGAFGVAMGGFG